MCAADVVDDCGHTAKNGQYVAERISSRVPAVIAVFSLSARCYRSARCSPFGLGLVKAVTHHVSSLANGLGVVAHHEPLHDTNDAEH